MKDSTKRLLRAGLVTGALVAAGGAASATGVFDDLDPERIRTLVTACGVWGVLAFLLLFALGELAHIPGMVFVVAGILAYGRGAGFFVALAGAVFSVTVSFVLVRKLGGQALQEIRWRFVQRLLARLDQRPVSTVFVLRSILWLAPPLNFALAMSNVRFRDYLVGSALGLVAPVAIVTLLFDVAVRYIV